MVVTGVTPELIAQNFAHGEEIQQALQMMGLRLSEGVEKGTRSTLVLILEKDGGEALIAIAQNGKNVAEPAPMMMVLSEVGNKGRMAALAASRRPQPQR